MNRTFALLTVVTLSGLSARAGVTGHWDFNAGDLSATVGTAMDYLDGAGGATQTGTAFGSTTDFGIASIGGQPAQVMRFPKMANAGMGYLLTHGALPNGGGFRVNQYTLILDVLYPTASSGKWRCITQTDNSGDGDFFVNPANGIGISGSYAGNVTPDVWHRLVFAVDLTGPAPLVSKFIDGVKVADQVLGQGLDARWSLLPTINFLNDEDGESELGYINSLQVRDVKLSDAFVALLGGPSAAGIPRVDLPEHPYVESTTPPDGAQSVAADTLIAAVIVDGQNPVQDGTIQLRLNGAVVAHTLTEDGYTNVVSYQPPAPLAAGSTNTASVTYSDGTGSFTNTWTFVVRALAQPQAITGQWDFDRGDLSATIGLPLEYFDGGNGDSAAATQFGTTTSFGIPDISGAPAGVLRFAGASTPQVGYIMRHGAVPNGTDTATKVNQWTLIMDLLIPHQGAEDPSYFAFVQINDLNNGGDADLFARFSGNTAGIGIGGEYTGAGGIVAGQWHRVAFAVDMAAEAPVISKFIDGVKFADQPRSLPQLDGRHAMASYALLFADEDSESELAYVSSIQFRNYKMSDQELAALGGPSPYGIPTVSGHWDFENGDLAATIGTDLAYRPDAEFYTMFGSDSVGGTSAQVMLFNGTGADAGYIMTPGALPNGGGLYVNQFTLIFDLKYPSTSGGFRSLLQTATNNANDGDLFVNGSHGIGISSQYQGVMAPDEWHRVAFTFDLTKRELGKFLNGTNVLTGPIGSAPLGTGPYQYLSSGVDGRWSLYEQALLFADEDGDLAPGLANSIQFRVGVLPPEHIALLGGPTAAGIPVNLPVPPRLTVSYSSQFNEVTVSWPAGVTGFSLESSGEVGANAVWEPVNEVSNNSAILTASEARRFFRLRK